MNGPFEQFSDEELRAAALKIEQAARKLNAAFLKVGFVDGQQVLPAVIEVYSEMLRFDGVTKANFTRSVEEKRVQTIAQGNVIVSCVLCAAVALSELKKSPKPAQPTYVQKQLLKFRDASTNPMSLAGLSLAGFYGLLGKGVFRRAKQTVDKKILPGIRQRLTSLKIKGN